jgi:hypothetical protein
MTLPFFGAGIVELPPEGFKRAKNSRKMQMVFFVHQGKVLVTVGPPSLEQNGNASNDAEMNEFAISKGGVWVVPRGMLLIPLLSPSPFLHNNQRECWKAASLLSRVASFQSRPREKSGQQSLPAHLLVFEDAAQGAVCATNRRNNLTRAPEHRTSCVALHHRHTPSLQALCAFGELEGSSRVTSQMTVCACVFGCTTALAFDPCAREP